MKDKRLAQILQDVEDFKLEYGDDYTLEEAEEWISLDDTYTNGERRYFLDCLSSKGSSLKLSNRMKAMLNMS